MRVAMLRYRPRHLARRDKVATEADEVMQRGAKTGATAIEDDNKNKKV